MEIIIPPPKSAGPSPQSVLAPFVRDRHIEEIRTKGRMAWQKATGYNQRSRVETQIGRRKTVIGPKLKPRHSNNQKTEAKIGVVFSTGWQNLDVLSSSESHEKGGGQDYVASNLIPATMLLGSVIFSVIEALPLIS